MSWVTSRRRQYSLHLLAGAKELCRVKRRNSHQYWYTNAMRYSRNYFPCLTRSGQWPIPGTSMSQEVGILIYFRVNINHDQSLRGVCSKQSLFWPGSSSWDKRQSCRGTVSPAHTLICKLYLS